MSDSRELVLVLDFGGQYKELIARAVRGLSVYSEIRPGNMPIEEIKRLSPIGIIMTGGPSSVYQPGSPTCDPAIFGLGIPVLGICYGMHLMCHTLGGEVTAGGAGEYGRVTVTPENPVSTLFHETQGKPFEALMSHRDVVSRLPAGFRQTASTAVCIAACENAEKKLYAVQFHPETKHTDGGSEIFRRFLYEACGAAGSYKLDDYIDTQVGLIRHKVGGGNVLLALSGGVDSSVCASLLSRAVPNQLVCIFVDHGFMRLNEGDEIERVFSKRKLRFIRVNAQERFLKRLDGVADPETKRKLIGEEFVRVFEEESAKLGDVPFLAQGTIYPDIVESGGSYGATIKSHHNVGGLPKNLKFTGVVEPLSGLFKDEVRILGRKLGLPAFLVNRQPFPGPGLAIRVVGDVTEEKLNVLRKADAILREELDGVKNRPDQYFAVLTNTCSVGVKGDERTYSQVIAIRAVITGDFMTCDYAPIPHKTLGCISSRITSEIPSVSRVVYDITSKPPATVEWE
ncbi:MAG: glutamine-hydrolyzing GMP synthase [Chitinispirillales bacterium]|jgi:GMP synthase (glutamine-hydrolysing)|nr:glutamine-hydrolyzing GMP synthase [Chitinispirillales bacterium]